MYLGVFTAILHCRLTDPVAIFFWNCLCLSECSIIKLFLLKVDLDWLLSLVSVQLSWLFALNDHSFGNKICLLNVTAWNLLVQAVIKPSFPYINRFRWPSGNEIISMPTKPCIIGMTLYLIFKLTFLRIPYLRRPIIGRTYQIMGMWMKVYWLYWSSMSFIGLDHTLWP